MVCCSDICIINGTCHFPYNLQMVKGAVKVLTANDIPGVNTFTGRSDPEPVGHPIHIIHPIFFMSLFYLPFKDIG